jgi:putative radical SAM enzyme (TIGR03279 family)
LKISSIKKGSQADSEGLLAGDELLAVNGQPVRDDIDLMFYGAEDMVYLTVRREGHVFEAACNGYEELGVEIEPMQVMNCGNNCLFCFVDQNPPGMRNAVYIKDEDYRFSFLHGAYVTLTTLSEKDIARIIEQRLSPLYISVHATEPDVRRKILGIKRDDRLMEKIDRLLENSIHLHCQIVVCPGINDGFVLEKSIRDLAGRYPGILSLAVVPVGLTTHREGLFPLRAANAQDARETIELVDRLRAELYHPPSFIHPSDGGDSEGELDYGFVYCSDEWYCRAGMDIPEADYYDDFPQIENGVGMIREFLDAVERLETSSGKLRYNGKAVIVTGFSMAPFMEQFAKRLCNFTTGLDVRIRVVPNRFYGESVTVSGLLTGRDIISALQGIESDETVLLPPNCLNAEGLFLDDLSPEDVSSELGVNVVQGEYDPVATFFTDEE